MNFGGKRMEKLNFSDKVFKAANDKSTLDVQAALHYWKEKPHKSEAEYKGKMIFNISDHSKKDTVYAQAFVDKATSKVFLNAVRNGVDSFKRVFPRGFSDYGGSENKATGEIQARVFKAEISNEDRGQFKLSITVGKGTKKQDTGAFQMVSPELTVTKYMGYDEMLKMAYETLDYINQAELAAMIKGEPLVSKIYRKPQEDGVAQTQKTSSQSSKPASTGTASPTSTTKKTVSAEDMTKSKELVQKLANVDVTKLKDTQLDYIMVNLKPINEQAKEILRNAKTAIQKRKEAM